MFLIVRAMAAGFEIVEGTSGTVVVAFGGMMHLIGGVAPFEFLGSLDQSLTRVFLRDLDQVWYQRGVRGLGSDIASTVSTLRGMTEGSRVVMLGASAGGFAALLFGSLLGADEVVAFGPRTFLGRWRRWWHADERLQARAVIAQRCPNGVLDVRRAVASAGGTNFTIHVGTEDPIDGVHARRIEGPNVAVYQHECGHNVGGYLRDRGELAGILTSVISR